MNVHSSKSNSNPLTQVLINVCSLNLNKASTQPKATTLYRNHMALSYKWRLKG